MKNVNIKHFSGQCIGNILLFKIYNRCFLPELNQRGVIMKILWNIYVPILGER